MEMTLAGNAPSSEDLMLPESLASLKKMTFQNGTSH